MTTLRTDLGHLRESARRIRFEIVGGIDHTDVQTALQQIALNPPAIVSTPVNAAASPYAVLSTDTYLYVDTGGGPITINLQAQANRAGVPLVIKDVTGHAVANNILLVANGAETTDSDATYLINADFGGVTLNPLTGGYTVAP